MAVTVQSASTAEDEELIKALVEMSRHYGSDPRLVLAGGGNTSVKLGDHLLVKGSGSALCSIEAGGFVDLDRAALQAVLDSDLSGSRDEREAEFKQAVLAARRQPERDQRPSVESVLHHLIPARFVVHLHATLVNQFSCCSQGRRLIEENLGEDVAWVELVDPGFVLAKTLQRELQAFGRRTGKNKPRAVIMQNHGLVVSGDTPEEVQSDIDWLCGSLLALRDQAAAPASFRARAPLSEDDGRAAVNLIAPALRALLSRPGGPLAVVTFDGSPTAADLVTQSSGRDMVMSGPITPDHIVYCRSFPLWVELRPGEMPADLVGRLAAAVERHTAAHGAPPIVVLVEGLGVFTSGATWADANTARLVYLDAVEVMTMARRMGGVHYLPDDFREFIEHWEVESYRRGVAAMSAGRSGRAAGTVALITGAAQGFGLGIAQDLAAEGGHVILADVNSAGAREAAADLSARFGEGRAYGLAMDVTSAASVAQAVHEVVRAYGGLDLLVSNAGILRAASVKVQREGDFDLSTAVNYKGYFLCVQNVAPVLAVQHEARPDYWSDIVQVNSKSGLEGSNKNFAYAGSKFGGIGLTQSFALELVEDGIKVNSVCPGNFFDGPLWSDPETGLFSQYLRTGKVPGATTIADVRQFYEAKVPMGRGCTAGDVMKAIYYLVEQKYETGQALPVTGGQVMLR